MHKCTRVKCSKCSAAYSKQYIRVLVMKWILSLSTEITEAYFCPMDRRILWVITFLDQLYGWERFKQAFNTKYPSSGLT